MVRVLCFCLCDDALNHLHTFSFAKNHHPYLKDREGFLMNSPGKLSSPLVGTHNAAQFHHLQDPSNKFQLFSPKGHARHNHIIFVCLQNKHGFVLRAPKCLEKINCHRSLGSPKNIGAFAISSPKPPQRQRKLHWLAFKFLEYILKR